MSNLERLLEVFRDERLSLPPMESPEAVAGQMETFLGEWSRWNDKINLTAERDASAVIEKHIFDSLQYARAVVNPRMHVMDIGSGAGFPGIPLKVISPDIKMVLVESQRKRANFLRNCVRRMALANVEVLNMRGEEVGKEYHGKFDLVLFRGVGSIAQCLQLAGPFLKAGGQVAIKKGPDAGLLEKFTGEPEFLALQEDNFIEGFTGIPSKLMRFERCST